MGATAGGLYTPPLSTLTIPDRLARRVHTFLPPSLGLPLAFPWPSLGLPLAFPRLSLGLPSIFPRSSLGLPSVLQSHPIVAFNRRSHSAPPRGTFVQCIPQTFLGAQNACSKRATFTRSSSGRPHLTTRALTRRRPSQSRWRTLTPVPMSAPTSGPKTERREWGPVAPQCHGRCCRSS